ncbi:Protein of unknown function [Bacillus wiedmannii]|uniref:Uncharacterized protein n=1 Tax=Bacillus wiedmannii TaxID=1890302 RepID=A0AB37YSM5_9BACI|nr:Protein of unknown function [Bacillus wiedmannii]SCN08061.1 Protein of unknown function [Bacillus wiedmannii]
MILEKTNMAKNKILLNIHN